MGHALESTVAPYFVHSALVSMQAPCWHQPCRLAPQRSVGVLNAHCPSQHSPLHSAPAASWLGLGLRLGLGLGLGLGVRVRVS